MESHFVVFKMISFPNRQSIFQEALGSLEIVYFRCASPHFDRHPISLEKSTKDNTLTYCINVASLNMGRPNSDQI